MNIDDIYQKRLMNNNNTRMTKNTNTRGMTFAIIKRLGFERGFEVGVCEADKLLIYTHTTVSQTYYTHYYNRYQN